MKAAQFGWVFVIIILLTTGFLIYQTQELSALIAIPIISVLLLLLFYKLTIVVNDDVVCFSFGIGLIRGKYKLIDIVKCNPVSFFPFGWGIRLKPGVILFNVSGNKAIELELKNKNRKVWIGTNNPDEISQYINSMKAKG
jgi:hypothetical protein